VIVRRAVDWLDVRLGTKRRRAQSAPEDLSRPLSFYLGEFALYFHGADRNRDLANVRVRPESAERVRLVLN